MPVNIWPNIIIYPAAGQTGILKSHSVSNIAVNAMDPCAI